MVATMTGFKTIGIFTSLLNRDTILVGRQIEEILAKKGCRVLFDKSFENSKFSNKFKTTSSEYLKKNSDLIIAIGGDGAMLSCSRAYGSRGVPILGVNLGKLGFLTDIAPDELTSRLLEVIDGNYIKDQRFFLKSTVKGSRRASLALNEVVIHSGAIAQMIEYDLYIDEVFVFRQKADGLIICSPTGSTAYSLSAGGPIIHPNLDVISIIPMLPQSLTSSPLVVSAESRIKVILSNNANRVHLSFDSHNSIKLSGKNEINICKSNSMLEFIHPSDHDFYDGCRNKLGWSSAIINLNN
ncbi:MAG: NAD(+) kinase [Rickettsiales bacterium]|nr:NAD(+) kinase [Rickettsiales bacterium]|tara:strand:- start:4888 stop:5778 length:891 start_codon:yes stop_codon:yes gene_type:complete